MKVRLFLLIFLLSIISLEAKVNFNGAYESSFALTRDDQDYKWQLDHPWHRIELRLFADPVKNTEFFLKTYADSWRTIDGVERKEAFYVDEAHIKYIWGGKDFMETFLFVRETRFWLGDPLLNLVNNDYDKWDCKKVSGFTHEINGYIPGFWSKFFAAKMYESDVDTGGARIYKKFADDYIFIGSTCTYKKWTGGKNNYNMVYAGDLGFHLFKKKYITITGEVAGSQTPTLTTEYNDEYAYIAELKGGQGYTSSIFKTHSTLLYVLGSFGYRFAYRDIGRDFRAYLSKDYDNDSKFDQKGYQANLNYFFPVKAINLKYFRDYYDKHYENYTINDNQFEIYIEFIKGFRWKNWYQLYHELSDDKVEVTLLDGTTKEVNSIDNLWRHYLTQLEMENDLAYVKLQFKIMNIYTDYLKYLYGVEYTINITDKMKSINRLAMIDEINRTRKTFFSQIQYRYGDNTDFYLGYGDENHSNDDLINDNDFANSEIDIVHKIHLYVKVGF